MMRVASVRPLFTPASPSPAAISLALPNHQRLVLSRTSHQCVGPLKPVRSPDLHFPIIACARTDDRHSPISRPVTQSVFHQRPNFSAGARITYVMQFERDSHFNAYSTDDHESEGLL